MARLCCEASPAVKACSEQRHGQQRRCEISRGQIPRTPSLLTGAGKTWVWCAGRIAGRAFLGLESIAICGSAESRLDGTRLCKSMGTRMHAAQCEGHAGHIPAPLHGRVGGALGKGERAMAAHRGDAGFAGLVAIVESFVGRDQDAETTNFIVG